MHVRLLPRTYVEIGVNRGNSLTLALPGTRAVGIDPEPRLRHPISRSTKVFPWDSDTFFEMWDLEDVLGGRKVDLAFIDGMHLFEFALRDFANLEPHCTPESVIVLHDCLPANPARGGAKAPEEAVDRRRLEAGGLSQEVPARSPDHGARCPRERAWDRPRPGSGIHGSSRPASGDSA